MGGDICQPTPPLRALCLYQNSTRMIGQITPCQLMNVVYRLQVFLCLPCAGMYMPLSSLFPLHQNHFFFFLQKAI